MSRKLVLRRGLAVLADRLSILLTGVVLTPLFHHFIYPQKVIYFSFMISVWIVSFVLPPFYFTLLEGRYGKSFGKHLFYLKVVNQEKDKITYPQSLLRNVIRIIDAFPGFYLVGLIAVLITDGKRIGDIVARTQVIDMANN